MMYLSQLSIQNFATFDNHKIEFCKGFNVIVGETGSGKSLILDALQLILGSRSDKSFIRKSCEFSTLEATFKVSNEKIRSDLEELGFPFEGDEIIVKRVLYKNGKSKAYLNFQNCPISLLNEFSRYYIDLVGQFENQKLLSREYQLGLLDSYSGLESLLEKYETKFQKLAELRNENIVLEQKQKDSLQQRDFLQYQIDEIEALELTESEEDSLENEKNKLQGLENSRENCQLATNLINENERSLSRNLQDLTSVIGQLPLDERQMYVDRIDDFSTLLDDLSFQISKLESYESSPEVLGKVLDKLDKISRLKRKHQLDFSALLEKHSVMREELNSFGSLLDLIEENKKLIEKISLELFSIAKKLHTQRVSKSKILSKALTKAIQELNMVGAILKFDLYQSEQLGPKGISQIQFLSETNPGEGFFEVKKSASGGELSRILLALRQVLGQVDSISVFLFDEIDSGIGGETALHIGKSLKKVSNDSQVIAITHLPQIATNAENIVVVKKKVVKEGPVRTLSYTEKIVASTKKKFIESMTPLN